MALTPEQAAEHIRILRAADMSDEEIHEGFPGLESGWSVLSQNKPATRERGSGSIARPATARDPF
jgi:hypothetical protein